MLETREAVPEDLPAILEIYNEAVRNLTATFDLEEQTLEQRRIWFNKFGGIHPIIVIELENEIAGYGTLGSFRDKPAYARTTELSLYLSAVHRGKGIGTFLMKELLTRANDLGYHTIIGGISGGNEASVKLHQKFGFNCVGCFKEVGFKFGSWQDVHFYQKSLSDN